jgi:hypothetical protein
VSLAVAFKGPEGVVLAADSRVTLTRQGPQGIVPATFDSATKLLRVAGQDFIGFVTYGAGALGTPQPRTAHGFLPEFEAELSAKGVTDRLTVEDFARRLGEFFTAQWHAGEMPAPGGSVQPLVFLVCGFDPGGDPYGRVFEVVVPTRPEPDERNPGNTFGLAWGGQREIVDRLLTGFDGRALSIARSTLHLDDAQTAELDRSLRKELSTPIPFQFLPLQACVDLCVFLVRATADLQTWTVDVRGVGGPIDVATVTRTEGFQAVQRKRIAAPGVPYGPRSGSEGP